ncbi:hypothetical protein P7C70_g1192, partial [Phenoliferia sp. Uapishka_3]
MRESNFNYPTQNRAAVCISSALYDRRAIDAPSPSLPLVNSLTHLSYLTATSPRIREILSLDGGIERLVRILKGCATGGPEAIEESLSQLKGKGKTLAKGSRRSPFKAFSEYQAPTSLPPTTAAANFPAFSFDDESTPFPSFPPSYASSSTLSPPPPPPPSERSKHLIYTYTLAFQCVVNIGVRGSEMIRTRVVEAGALDVVVHVLERYLEKSAERKRPAVTDSLVVPITRIALEAGEPTVHLTVAPPSRVPTPDTIASMDDGVADDTASSSGHDEEESTAASRRPSSRRAARTSSKLGRGRVDRDGDVVMSADEDERSATQAHEGRSSTNSRQQAADGVLQYRDEDVLLSLQLLAYLSKYPHVRSAFHIPSDAESGDEEEHNHPHDACGDLCTTVRPAARPSKAVEAGVPVSPPTTPTLSSNVFSLVEAFTHRPPASDKYTPRHSNEVQYWAGVIMRNACRKDENQGGIRQCANMQCGVWEKTAREFAKCRRCRKAKYCSKSCQSKAWQFGHRYWCTKATPRDDGEAEGGDDSGAAVPRARSGRHRGEGRGARGGEHLHSHGHNDSRPGTAQSFDDDEEDDLPSPPSGVSTTGEGVLAAPGATPRATRHRLSIPHALEHHQHQHSIVGVAGMGVRVGPDDMDEDRMAHELMGGGVFGDMGVGGGVVDA